MRELRDKCPWDAKQTHGSLTRHVVEETYEVLDAIAAVEADPDTGYPHLCEELGDLLLQVVFHANLAAEAGRFDLNDVASTVHDKIVGRHPHVFGDVKAATEEEVMANWESIKRDEKGRGSVFDGIPRSLPALQYAHKVIRKAANFGASSSLRVGSAPEVGAGSLGGRLYALVAEAIDAGLDPEIELRRFTDEAQSALRLVEPNG